MRRGNGRTQRNIALLQTMHGRLPSPACNLKLWSWSICMSTICVYICIYTYVYVYTHAYMYTDTCACALTYKYTHRHAPDCIPACAYASMHVDMWARTLGWNFRNALPINDDDRLDTWQPLRQRIKFTPFKRQGIADPFSIQSRPKFAMAIHPYF